MACSYTTTLFTLQRWWEVSKIVFESWFGDGCWFAHKPSSLPFMCRASACKCNVLGLTNTFPNLEWQPGRTGGCTSLDMFVQLFMLYSQLIHLFWRGQDVFIFCLGTAHFIILMDSLWQVAFANTAFCYWHCFINGWLSWFSRFFFFKFSIGIRGNAVWSFFCPSVRKKCSSFPAICNKWLKWSS